MFRSKKEVPFTLKRIASVNPLPLITVIRGIIPVILVSYSVFHFRKVLDLWWTYDDPFILHLSITQSIVRFFYDPAVYHKLTVVNFTPLLPLSFWMDYCLAGTKPFIFYLHQIFLLGYITFAIYWLLKRWNLLAACCAAALFLFSGPAAASAHLLMTRHYLEGACFCLTAMLLLLSPGVSLARAWLAALAYLLACLCKEVYIPVVLAVPFLISGPWPRRLRISSPLLLMLCLYIPWRFYMLSGNGLGGYSSQWITNLLNWRYDLTGFKELVCSLWSWNRGGTEAVLLSFGYGSIIVLLIAFHFFRYRQWDRSAAALVLIGGAFGAIIPLWGGIRSEKIISYRLLVHISILNSIGIALAWSMFQPRRIKSASQSGWKSRTTVALCFFLPIVLFSAFNQNYLIQTAMKKDIRPHIAENLFYFTQRSDITMVSITGGHHWQDLGWLRYRQFHSRPPSVCIEPYDLRPGLNRYYCYSSLLNGFENCTKKMESSRANLMRRFNRQTSLSVGIRIDKGTFKIQVGAPETDSLFYLLIGSRHNIYWRAMPIPRMLAGNLYTHQVSFYIRILKMLPDGSWGLSPEWILDMSKQQSIHWAGQSVSPPLLNRHTRQSSAREAIK